MNCNSGFKSKEVDVKFIFKCMHCWVDKFKVNI